MTVASSELGKPGSDRSHAAASRGGLDSAFDGVDSTADDMAYAVEKCQCPEGYSGLSCQVGRLMVAKIHDLELQFRQANLFKS